MSKHLGIAILFAVLLGTAAASAAGPREPLAFRNVGLYITGWGDYFIKPDCPFDFFIVAANGPFEGRDNSDWNRWLKLARKNGTRVIANLNPQVKTADGKYTNISLLGDKADDAALDAMVRVIGEFFAQVDVNELYAVTLCEEQIFWNGQAENLNKLYEKMKAKYDVPVYQWYSGSSAGSPPGTLWPNLKSDGWVADEYYLDQPNMEQVMRAYRIQQKPILQVIWAGGEKATVPYLTERFWQQVEVCRKYDIPTAYFTHNGEGAPWGWSENAPAFLKSVFEQTIQVARQARTQTRAVDTMAWDFVPWKTPAIQLRFASKDDKKAVYHEEFVVDRTVRFVNDAEIAGFANLRWDSSPIELRPQQAGQVEASITYAFESPFKITQLRVSSPGFAAPDKQAAVSMAIVDSQGAVKRTAKLTSKGTLKLVIRGSELDGQQFKVVFALSGTASAGGETLAGISALDVVAEVLPPDEKVIDLRVDGVGGVAYEGDLSSMSIYHTAQIKRSEYIIPVESGLHVNAPSQSVEVIQKFRAPGKIDLARLTVRGRADETGQAARLGIGVSLNGVDLLAKKMSAGSFNGELQLEPGDLEGKIQSDEFYVHLFLEGGYGLITSYGVAGKVAG